MKGTVTLIWGPRIGRWSRKRCLKKVTLQLISQGFRTRVKETAKVFRQREKLCLKTPWRTETVRCVLGGSWVSQEFGMIEPLLENETGKFNRE